VSVTVRAAPPEHLSWIAQRARLVLDRSFRAIEAVDGDRILGMVGFDGWLDNACCVHVAIEHPLALRHLLRPGFGIPFNECGFGVVIAKVLSTNERSLALVKHLGFREVCRGKDWVRPGIDLVVLEMRRDDCRFLPHEMRRVA
jgi:RimJ/RimL family protein N-acetyltransferase